MLRTAAGPAGWDFWITATFTHDVSEARARAAQRRYLRQAARFHDEHFLFGSVLGPRPGGRELHFHLLLKMHSDGKKLTVNCLDRLWRYADRAANFAHVRKFDPKGGAERYMATHQTLEGPAYLGGLERNFACPRHLPCRRRKGCIAGPSWR